MAYELLSAVLLTLMLSGCGKSSLRSQNPDDDDVKTPQTQFIKDQVTVSGLNAGKTYTCVIKATNSRGTGPVSSPTPAVNA